MSSVKGTVLELKVAAAIESGDIEPPEGAVDFLLAGRNEPALDGWQ